jgi:DNA modification methylase
MTQFKIYNGNCLDVLRNAPDNFADSIVCDPPYGLWAQAQLE